MMLATRRPLGADGSVVDDGTGLGGSDAAPGVTPVTAPATPAPTAPQSADPASPTKTPKAATDVTPSMPSEAGQITQIADGAGGAVAVPPVAIAPSTAVPPAAQPATPAPAVDAQPWETTQANTVAAQRSVPVPTGEPWDTTPTTPPASTTPTVATDPTSSSAYDAENNLIGSQINPTTGARLASLQGRQDATLSAIDKMNGAAADPGPAVLPTSSPRALALQATQDAQLGKVTNGPDRLALAKQYMAESDPEYQHAITDATSAAASHGILGSGMLTNKYGDLASSRQREIDKYLTDATAGTIGDNLNNLGASRGIANDAAEADAGARGELRTERSNTQSVAAQAIARRMAQANLESGMAGDQAAQDASARNELRTERGFQTGEADKATNAAIAQQAAEAGMSEQDFQDAIRLYALGQQNNPTDALNNAAGLASSEAGGNSAMTAQLIAALAKRNPQTAGVTG